MKYFVFFSLFLLQASAFAASPWGITAHVPSGADFEHIDELGARWVRIDFNWSDIEHSRKGSYSWGSHDAAVDEALSRGLRVFGTIAYTPRWARSGGGHNEPPLRSSDWQDFVYACVSRYRGRVSHWGMWNEPNLPEFWTGTMREYVYDILIPGARAVRAADPGALVLGPELSCRNRIYTLESLAYILSNAGDYIDIVTQHAYGEAVSVFFFLDEQVLPVLNEFAPGKELWLTETGFRSDVYGEEYQASFYRQVCAGVLDREYLNKVFFYKLVDGFEPEDWGLLDRNYRRKEAFSAYRGKIKGEPYHAECFIAGAVFGNGSSEVENLRVFRDGRLSESFPGRALISGYYRLSPPMALVFSRSAFLGRVVRLHLRGVLFLLGG